MSIEKLDLKELIFLMQKLVEANALDKISNHEHEAKAIRALEACVDNGVDFPLTFPIFFEHYVSVRQIQGHNKPLDFSLICIAHAKRLLSLKGFGKDLFAKLDILEKDLFSPRSSTRHAKTASQSGTSDLFTGGQELARLGSNSFTKSDSSVTPRRPYFAAQAGYALSHRAMVHALRANSSLRLNRYDSTRSESSEESNPYEELIFGEGRDHLIASEACWQECNNVAFLCPVSTPPCMRNRGENERMVRTRAVRGSELLCTRGGADWRRRTRQHTVRGQGRWGGG